MTKRKLTREEIEEDILVTRYYQTQQYLKDNKALVIGVAVAIVVVIGGIIGYSVYSENQETKAQNMLSNAQMSFMQADYENALNGNTDAFTAGFKTVMSEYGGTKAANLAHYYASVSAFKLGQTTDALSYIQDFKTTEGILGVAPIQFYASLLEAEGNFSQAGDKYVEAAEWEETPTTTPQNYINAANAYIAAGNSDKALTIINRLLDDSEIGANYVTQAKKLKGQLKSNA
jgi:hypothetical protein